MPSKKSGWLLALLLMVVGSAFSNQLHINDDLHSWKNTKTEPIHIAPNPLAHPQISIPNFSGDPNEYPYVEIESSIGGKQGTFKAIGTSPSGSTLSFAWWQDDTNPEPLELSETSGEQITVTIPDTVGEYFINVTAQDTNKNTFTARRLITVDEVGAYVNTNDHHANWINHMNLYEINPYDWNKSHDDRFIAATNYLDRLVDLGVNTVWFTPIFQGDGMGYWTEDYYQIHQWLGYEGNFKKFVDVAHEKGIRVVLDLVFNHTWTEHPFMQDVLANKDQSPYADYYLWHGTPGNSTFDFYFDWDHLPNLNVDNPEVQEYLIRVAEYWVINYDIDGYRLDVAWGVEQRSDTFWLNLTNRLKNIKPEIFLLGETPAAGGTFEFTPSNEHDKNILFDDRFASVYDWRLRNWSDKDGLPGVLIGWKSISQLNEILTDKYPPRALPLRFIENHDLPRAAEILDIERSKLAHTLVFTIPGVPLIYGGAEHGQIIRMAGVTNDPDKLESYFASLINARENYIDNDSMLEILINNNNSRINSYATHSEDSIVISALNFGDQPVIATIDLAPLQAQVSAYSALVDVFETGKCELADDISSMNVSLEPYEACVLIFVDEQRIEASIESHSAPEGSSTDNLLQNGDFTDGLNG